MEMENLTKLQVEIGNTMASMLENIRKTARDKRTEGYIEKKKEEVEKLWATFQHTHDKIIQLNQPEHNYFKQNYYGQVEKFKRDINNTLSAFSSALLQSTSGNFESNLNPREIGVQDEPKHLGEEATGIKNVLLACKRETIRIESLAQQLQQIDLSINLSTAVIDYHTKNLTDNWGRLEQLHEELLLHCDISGYETEELQSVIRQYSAIKREYTTKIIALQEMKSEVLSPSEHDVRLPRLTIPTFEGKYETWRAFHDIFVKLIHNNRRLANVEKLQYLKSNLKGEASKLLTHLEVSDANYTVAWELLNNRYDNKRKLISAHLQTLLSIPKLENESIFGLKKIHDTMKECLHGISNLNVDVSSWAPIVIHLMIQRFDYETLKLYEQSLANPKEVPSFDAFYNFLEARFQSLETIGENKKRDNSQKAPTTKFATPYRGKLQTFRNYHAKNAQICKYCRNEHSIYNCPEFQQLEVQLRKDFITKTKLCRNCLNHSDKDKCHSKYKCNICQKPHHSLLHEAGEDYGTTNNSKFTSRQAIQSKSPSKVQNHVAQQNSTVLLATALVKARNINGALEPVRALIDPGSQASYITESTAQLLALPRIKVHAEVAGIGTSDAGIARSKVHMEIQPRFPSIFRCQIEALVLPKLTSILPDKDLELTLPWQHKIIADPTFDKPGPVDIIIGADIFGSIILDGVERDPKGLLMQNTELGWIISGPTHSNKPAPKIVSMISNVEIDDQLKRFWELEQVPSEYQISNEDQDCELQYSTTCVRNQDGKYTVKIPFKETPIDLRSTRKMALARLLHIEKRFQADKVFEKEYNKFMNEYIELKHMTLAEPSEAKSGKVCYLPHHAVIKSESTTTKLRVVFDASARTTEGKSLNDLMHTGPQLQQDLATILLRWRKHRYVLTADIEKMYRQIKLCEEDQEFQRILWRRSPNEPISEYKLTTVTYGTAAAPYLAIRTLQQLAKDEKEKSPIAANIILRDFYVDDMLTGADTIEKAEQIQQEVTQVLASGGFHLRKWASNQRELLEKIPEDLRTKDILEIADGNTIKTLGVHWSPARDTFHFKLKLPTHKKLTKRLLLSDTAKIFDPLGWLTPITVRAKLMLQNLWRAGITWDENLPTELVAEWTTFRAELPRIEEIQIPRWTHEATLKMELHGFSDASERAYAAVIYSKVVTNSGEPIITLLTAKSKVAPISSKPTIPQLELCGAVLLAKLMQHTIKAMEDIKPTIYLWSDSMVALGWIKADPAKLKRFIAHRVTEIQAITSPCQWNYVKSEDNPADCASRGINPSQLCKHQQWWTGPCWLKDTRDHWSKLSTYKINTDCTLQQEAQQIYTTLPKVYSTELIERFSTIRKLVRVVAYCNRFIQNSSKRNTRPQTLDLDVTEINNANKIIIKIAQSSVFADDIKALNTKHGLNSKSKLLPLNPIIDEDGILRVGGRLEHAVVSSSEKHPIILPQKSHLTTLIIKEAHEKTLHGGNQSTLAYIRRRFWIINPRDSIRQYIHKCVKCFRAKAKSTQQMMGNLPAPRVTPSRPFTHTGVDYAGPILIKMSKGRGCKSYKGYIAAFICLATKAMHIEVVSDLTSEAFLAAFKRFTSRRGLCSHMYSDCGTNFIGARRILTDEFHASIYNSTQEVANLLANDGIQWHFNPPAAPHMGGLWEAGIKSIKYHLKRVIGETALTYEELTTVLHQIEASLNSRPLCPLSNDPEDMEVLTPGHFLIGAAPLTPPTNENNDERANSLTRWKLVNKLQRDFWKIWSSEYLSRLQQRPKWQTKQDNIKIGELVLIKDENIPPTKWLLARIVEVHPGNDGLTRVVSLRCKGNLILKRPITKICKLPIDEDQSNPDQMPSHKPRTNIATTKIAETSCKQTSSTKGRCMQDNNGKFTTTRTARKQKRKNPSIQHLPSTKY